MWLTIDLFYFSDEFNYLPYYSSANHDEMKKLIVTESPKIWAKSSCSIFMNIDIDSVTRINISVVIAARTSCQCIIAIKTFDFWADSTAWAPRNTLWKGGFLSACFWHQHLWKWVDSREIDLHCNSKPPTASADPTGVLEPEDTGETTWVFIPYGA